MRHALPPPPRAAARVRLITTRVQRLLECNGAQDELKAVEPCRTSEQVAEEGWVGWGRRIGCPQLSQAASRRRMVHKQPSSPPQSAAPGSCDSDAMDPGRDAAALDEAAVPASSWRRHISAAGCWAGRQGRLEGGGSHEGARGKVGYAALDRSRQKQRHAACKACCAPLPMAHRTARQPPPARHAAPAPRSAAQEMQKRARAV